MAAHRRARQPVRITKTVGTLAAAGAAGVGLVVFCFTPANSDGQPPAANVGSAVSIDPTPDATVQSATPARVTPTASPTSTATAHARTDDHQQGQRSSFVSTVRATANHRTAAESDSDLIGVAHSADQPTNHYIADADLNANDHANPDQP